MKNTKNRTEQPTTEARNTMSAYDATKDKLIEDLGMIEDSNLQAELRSYDGGEVKLAVFRVFQQKKGTTASRQLFRIPLSDVAVLGEFMMAVTAQYGTGENEESDEEGEG